MDKKIEPKLAYIVYKEDDYYVAQIPALLISEFGATEDEALKNLVKMEKEVFDIEKEHGNPLPTYEESVKALNKYKKSK